MSNLHYTIHPAIFARFPAYQRGVVLGYGLTNGPSPAALLTLLRAEEASLRQRLTPETLTEQAHIQAWREAFRALGIKPSEFRPSVEAMARRVLRGDSLPSINALVDIGNLLSLRHLIPVGGHSIDHLAQDITLCPAQGDEDFIAFGSTVLEHPNPGEFVFLEGSVVLCRRWVWRQSSHTLTLPETRSVEINIDALPPLSPADVQTICQQTQDLVSKFCGGRARFGILSAQNPTLSLKE